MLYNLCMNKYWLAILICLLSANIAFAKTESKASFFDLPGIKQVEGFRLKNLKQCTANFDKYGKLIGDKDLDQILDGTKRDFAYNATQQALPESLRQNNIDLTLNYDEPKNFLNYHLNSLCVKLFGSQTIYYAICILLIIIILKGFSR